MGFFGRLLGIEDETDRSRAAIPGGANDGRGISGAADAPLNDAQALERYRYMLRTAPPETLEEAHAEAFAKLSPEQRRAILAELTDAAPPAERAAMNATSSEDPRALARAATRAEVRQPGVLERSLGSGASGFGGGLLSSFAMGFVGSMVAHSFFSAIGGFGGDAAAESQAADEGTDDEGGLAENEADAGSYDDGGDFGGDDFDV
jgi:hypothetical protein